VAHGSQHKGLNVRPEILKLLQENIGKKLEDILICNGFMNQTPIAQEIRARINKWNYIKLKSFCTAKETIIQINRQPTEKIFVIYSLDKGLTPRIYKVLQKLSTKRTNNPINK
jgi:hypothetical protein